MVSSTFFNCSMISIKQTQVFSAPAGRQGVSTTLAAPQRDDLNSTFENADRLLEQKRTGSQFHSFTILRH
jgi:hypothetical protein